MSQTVLQRTDEADLETEEATDIYSDLLVKSSIISLTDVGSYFPLAISLPIINAKLTQPHFQGQSVCFF